MLPRHAHPYPDASPSMSGGNGLYAPPPGPPPSYRNGTEDYAPPAGPPPGRDRSAASGGGAGVVAPPAGPPPAYRGNGNEDYAPPAGPPPTQHDWQSFTPDTALLPPPPALFAGWDRSPANNATAQEADAGEDWCRRFPLHFPAMDLRGNLATRDAIRYGNINLQKPPCFQGSLCREPDGCWAGKSLTCSPDSCIIAFPPLYAPSLHSPRLCGRAYTAYYEVAIAAKPDHHEKHSHNPFRRKESSKKEEITLAIGFAAMPYPAFRLPGWHRGSLAVHGDDAHRFTNDTHGGKSFLADNLSLDAKLELSRLAKKDLSKAPLEDVSEYLTFQSGRTYGIGMRFSPDDKASNGIAVEVFITRDGMDLASWDLHEESDAAQDKPVFGLEGLHDLSLAIGTSGKVDFEVRLNPGQWKYDKMRVERTREAQE